MKTTTIVSKLSLVFKRGCLFLLLFITGSAYAEYYLVYSGCGSRCYPVKHYYYKERSCQTTCYRSCGDSCYSGCGGCTHYIYSSAPYRHNHYDPYQEESFEWVDP